MKNNNIFAFSLISPKEKILSFLVEDKAPLVNTMNAGVVAIWEVKASATIVQTLSKEHVHVFF